jgi:Domain of unknown function (DUF5680)
MDKDALVSFLLKARTKTYAGSGGKVRPVLTGSDQLEYAEGDWLYCDIYYTGNGIFMGLETVYLKDEPVLSMSYYGNFKKMTEKEIDVILKQALLATNQDTRIWKHAEWQKEDYKYICEPDFNGSLDDFAGLEQISRSGENVYRFFYAGGLLKS